MSSPWKKKQPEAVADMVLRRAEVSKMARKLQNRLALAQFKTKHGWEDLTLDTIEPKVEEELRRKRPSSSGDILSDSSSSASDFQYPRALMSSPMKAPIFSDDLLSSAGSTGHRKRTFYSTFERPAESSPTRKRYRASPSSVRGFRATDYSWKNQHHLPQSSPIRPRKQNHFTTTAGPSLSFYRATSNLPGDEVNYAAASDDEDNLLPMHSFQMPSVSRSSPPRTPPMRTRSLNRLNNKTGLNGKSEEGADLLLYLATSPSPAQPSRTRMQPPSTPPPRNPALPSSMMTTPGGTGLMAGFGVPSTPGQAFDFNDFVNINTPSPAQTAWTAKTPVAKTPLRKRLTFDNFPSSTASPSASLKHAGLGMQLGGDLLS